MRKHDQRAEMSYPKLLIIVILKLLVTTLCDEVKWPDPGAQCPISNVTNATCSCRYDPNSGEQLLDCVSKDDGTGNQGYI